YPVPTLRNLNASYPGWSLEDALDLEWSRAMAPGASIDMTLAPDSGATLYYSIDWLVAHQAVNVISLSWGEPDIGTFNSYASACASGCNATSDGSYTILHPVLVAAALEGIGVFSASGDCGAAMGTNGDSTSYPASDSYVTGVGATNLALANGQYGAESGWSGNDSGAKSPGCQNQGGSGGGFAPLPRPYWQVDAGLPTTPATRGVPDVSIVGGTPVVTVVDGFNDTLQGTSVSTPIWAGLATVADQLDGAPLGFLNPSLYALARGPSSTSLFHDVLQGSNGYSAGPGWDPVTGIGSPIASQLLPALSAGTVVPTGIFTELRASARFGPAPLTVTLSANASGGALPYAGFDLDFGDGNATWSTTGVANHTYPMAGTYIARAQTYDSNGNSSSAPPLLIVVGGGGALNVSLVANATHPMSGTAVQFTASVTGGASPYRYSFSFGDGTFAQNGTVASLSHSYAQAGGYCANVLVRDAAAPPDGGASLEVPITVGGANAIASPAKANA
ncbi:MAG: PKD domain-containing protein, partial [Thermoplasmata archaeon]|nr:PKD domain-containing protein [Thermoplasmata archaeon]